MVEDSKYVTFKKSVFEDFAAELCSLDGGWSLWERIRDQRLDDSVVIRRRDIFAAPALDVYSNSMLTCVEVLREVGQTEVADNLEEKAKYFHEQAVASWDTERKIPD